MDLAFRVLVCRAASSIPVNTVTRSADKTRIIPAYTALVLGSGLSQPVKDGTTRLCGVFPTRNCRRQSPTKARGEGRAPPVWPISSGNRDPPP